MPTKKSWTNGHFEHSSTKWRSEIRTEKQSLIVSNRVEFRPRLDVTDQETSCVIVPFAKRENDQKQTNGSTDNVVA